MSKILKAALQQMLDNKDGVTVVEAGKGFQVAFGFSNNLVNKIKAVPDAKFDKEQGVWEIPGGSGSELGEAVADMRDFVKNNGVQVKDTETGKAVLFDYNKELTQIIGKVDGAKFDNASRIWNVPANSKALIVEEGQSTNYLDMAVNKMRGIVIETTQDREKILALATEAAQGRGVKAAIVFPEKEHSYTGPILNVNAHFAAQLTGIDDKQGVAFIAIHDVGQLGKSVFKNDDLRIDYDENRSVNVRTTAVFQEQQKERDKLTALASGKVDGANIRNAATKDGSKHNGEVVEVSSHFVLQHKGRSDFVIHGRDNLDMADIKKGQKLEVTYKDGKGAVVDLDKQKGSKGQER